MLFHASIRRGAVNICIFGGSFLPAVGGMEYVMHNLANALAGRGHYVTVIAKRVSWMKPEDERDYNLKRYSFPIRGTGKMGVDYCSALFTVAASYSARKIDVLNCHGVSYPGTKARHLKYLFGFPLVMTPHGDDVQKLPDIGYGLRLNRSWDERISRNLKAADYITAISQSVRSDLDMVADERIVNIPNGIHVARFTGERSNYLCERLGIPETTRIILSVGRNHVVKGYDYGIQAITKLVKDLGCANVHYVIVGRNTSEHRMLVEECRVNDYISLLEEVPPDRITQCYKSSDIFFSPSLGEGLSLVSLEAMAAGLPLVVTNAPGNEDVVKDSGCGIIVKDQDIQSMAQGLLQLLDNDMHRLELAELSRKHSTRYDWAHIASMYEDVYRQAVEDCRNKH